MKLKLLGIKNEGIFNVIEIAKSSEFLENLQDFLINIKLEKLDERKSYEFDGKKYTFHTYYDLFDEEDENGVRKRKIEEFKNGQIIRRYNKDIELLIEFLNEKTRLIFYCSLKKREEIIKQLSKFVNLD